MATTSPKNSIAAFEQGAVMFAILTLGGLLQSAAHAQAPSQQLPLLPNQMGCDSCRAKDSAPASSDSDNAAPAAHAASPSFQLSEVRFYGAHVIDDAQLQAHAQPYIGRDVTLADLEAIAAAVTAMYRERGYLLAQAIVPVQTVRDGVLDISVIEGRIGKVEINLDAKAPIDAERVQGFLANVHPGNVVHGAQYERAMLLLSDQPGIRVGSTLQEGAAVGTTDLTVDVNEGKRWTFVADADNHGTKESGRFRVGGTVRWASPLGIGDNLDLRAMVSNGSGMQFGRLAYEAPIGMNGLRAGIGISRVNYELGGEFSVLGAQGKADVVDVSLNYPVIRQRHHNLYLRLAADSKQLKDEYRAVDFQTRKQVNGLGLGWAWERRDDWFGGGYWASAGTLYFGNLSIRDAELRAADQAYGGRGTNGSFSKLTFQFSRLQAIMPSHSLYVALGGQTASKNLDSSEKLALGGARAVRAYPSGEVLVDQGWIGTIEWRWSATSELTPYVFYDAARGRMVKSPSPFDDPKQWQSLRGAGVGLSWSRPGDFSINTTLAWRTGTPPPLTDGARRGVRFYVQAQKTF